MTVLNNTNRRNFDVSCKKAKAFARKCSAWLSRKGPLLETSKFAFFRYVYIIFFPPSYFLKPSQYLKQKLSIPRQNTARASWEMAECPNGKLTSGGPDSSLSEFCLFNINFGKGSSSESSRTRSENLCSGLKRKKDLEATWRLVYSA